MTLPTGPKVFPDARSALAGVVRDGITVMSGGFGLCGVPENLIDAELFRRLRLRGLNARVIQGGVVRVGDDVRRVAFSTAPSDNSGRSQTRPRG